MLMTRVIPCLLLSHSQLVKTRRFRNPVYVGDPVNAVKIYNAKEVDELIFLDITAAVEERSPSFDVISQIAEECFMPFTYGGGIRTTEDIKKVLALGVEKVAINSYAVENPSFIKEASAMFGNQSIVASIDVKKTFWGKYEVYSRGGRKATGLDPVEYARSVEEMGAGEILLNAIDRDGTMDGYDIGLVRRVSGAVQVPVIACGGAGSVAHFAEAVKEGGASAVAAGSLVVFQGRNRAVLISFPAREELERALA